MNDDGALAQAARAAGLADFDLLKLAKPGVLAADAVADLRRRYPLAFNGPPKHARNMTDAEFTAELAKLTAPKPRTPDYPTDKKVGEMTLDELQRFERYHGLSVSSAEQRRRAGVRAEQQRRKEIGI